VRHFTRPGVTLLTALSFGSFAVLASGAPLATAQSTTALTLNAAEIPVGNGPPVGIVLVTGDGLGVYELSFDAPATVSSPAQSSCTGACTKAWPPLLAPGPNGPFDAMGGVIQSELGTITRTDLAGGTAYQVTYFGHPLYNFSRDTLGGHAQGENVAAFNGIWRLVSPAGYPNAGVATVELESTAQGMVLATPTAFGGIRSLYSLSADPPGVATCLALCDQFWPPLLTTSSPIAGSGVDSAGLGTTPRPDGSTQVTYFGWPLHLFTQDLAAGAKSSLTNGLDVVDQFNQGIWYLLAAGGGRVSSAATLTSVSAALGTLLEYNPTGTAGGGTLPTYAFSADAAAATACNGLCARVWTPVLTTGAPEAMAGATVNASDLGTIQRADGSTQVTFDGHPLYTFAPSFSALDGQNLAGFGGVFHLVLASGALSSTAPATRSVVAFPQVVTSSYGTSASFTVAFSSTTPGQGAVLFGPGPGCRGLVEIGTQDAGGGPTDHIVGVTGNDLAGTIGNIGIQPGATYSFEVITATSSGLQTDDNKGSCYTITIPPS
jgi:predicted lipoprotein with Yx(FWY)xxD motif